MLIKDRREIIFISLFFILLNSYINLWALPPWSTPIRISDAASDFEQDEVILSPNGSCAAWIDLGKSNAIHLIWLNLPYNIIWR